MGHWATVYLLAEGVLYHHQDETEAPVCRVHLDDNMLVS